MTAYRNDDDAREMLVESLEVENKTLLTENEQLKAENAQIKSENVRLKIIGTELLRESPPVNRSPMVDAHMRRMIADQERAHAELMAQTFSVRRQARIVIALLAAFAAASYLIRLISLF